MMNPSGIEIIEVLPPRARRFLIAAAIVCLVLACLGLAVTTIA
jgi:hypothetical protein